MTERRTLVFIRACRKRGVRHIEEANKDMDTTGSCPGLWSCTRIFFPFQNSIREKGVEISTPSVSSCTAAAALVRCKSTQNPFRVGPGGSGMGTRRESKIDITENFVQPLPSIFDCIRLSASLLQVIIAFVSCVRAGYSNFPQGARKCKTERHLLDSEWLRSVSV